MVYLQKPMASRWIYCLLFAFFSVSIALAGDHTAAKTQNQFHQDHRQAAKVIFNPVFNAGPMKDETDKARLYLAMNAKKFSLPETLDNLELVQIQNSLTGRHYRFQQILDGIVVEGAQIVVSIDRTSGDIYRVYNNTYPVKTNQKAPSVILNENDAYDIAWSHLKVHGPLMQAPQIEKVFVPVEQDFQLVYKTLLAVEAPNGYWAHVIDAVSGKIVSFEEERITRNHYETELPEYDGPVEHRQTAFKTYFAQAAYKANLTTPVAKGDTNGTAMVFDPDPRTTLNNATLEDTTDAAAFDAAYMQRNLLDLTNNAGTYSLVGPYVQIVDVEAPNVAPSTTTDGNWDFRRGNVAFNDAMTYFHLDQSQRYMQSLGFTGDNGIQELSIPVDANGWSGQDNSSFSPGTNTLSFGHGCVDDNEDADVILHEYGHAIHFGINSNNWSGGDTGGMGEGFGDYWAGSYSYATPNGPTFNPNWVFTWDGHNSCWGGRIMNDMDARYDHSLTYPAHREVGGTYSDHLWATPLFQAFLNLVQNHNVPREEVDRIVLEAHFGLAAGPKMRDLANATVQTANRLHPDGPHGQAFFDAFLHHGILEIARAQMTDSTWAISDGTGENGVPDPGETLTFDLSMVNGGTADASQISAVVSTQAPGVVIAEPNLTFPDMATGATGQATSSLTVTLDDSYTCGSGFQLSMEVTFDDGSGRGAVTTTITHDVTVGTPVGFGGNATVDTAIPDDTAAGLTSTFDVTGATGSVSENMQVAINITHTWRGDLIVTLTSPAGTTVTLHNRTGSSADDLIGTFGDDLPTAEPLSGFAGEDPNGTWTLTVSDNANLDTGTFNSWGINDISDYICTRPNCAATATATATVTTICAGFPLQLGVTFDGMGESPEIRWSNPELLDDAASATPMATLTETTTFTVSLDGDNCQAVSQVTIEVTPGLEGIIPYWFADEYYAPADLDGDTYHTVLDMIMRSNSCASDPL
ncbi:proprotein convertase P-domain-containing protein [Acanthopleuribacter pedis]|uniref:Proprotein convertase P-domain-containing protein n=1 Tax=Acanthopleuribacter pedis TaxID=442870 RepID=A0A8J7PZQ7_9BACT|nr:proprotein convertase P-domain-containing protein [Acanthopleuribacter pedis]MBO1317722.1 proprotein convertase P-domain-containing protein [Acanthopleuribacter pedis]